MSVEFLFVKLQFCPFNLLNFLTGESSHGCKNLLTPVSKAKCTLSRTVGQWAEKDSRRRANFVASGSAAVAAAIYRLQLGLHCRSFVTSTWISRTFQIDLRKTNRHNSDSTNMCWAWLRMTFKNDELS